MVAVVDSVTHPVLAALRAGVQLRTGSLHCDPGAHSSEAARQGLATAVDVSSSPAPTRSSTRSAPRRWPAIKTLSRHHTAPRRACPRPDGTRRRHRRGRPQRAGPDRARRPRPRPRRHNPAHQPARPRHPPTGQPAHGGRSAPLTQSMPGATERLSASVDADLLAAAQDAVAQGRQKASARG